MAQRKRRHGQERGQRCSELRFCRRMWGRSVRQARVGRNSGRRKVQGGAAACLRAGIILSEAEEDGKSGIHVGTEPQLLNQFGLSLQSCPHWASGPREVGRASLAVDRHAGVECVLLFLGHLQRRQSGCGGQHCRHAYSCTPAQLHQPQNGRSHAQCACEQQLAAWRACGPSGLLGEEALKRRELPQARDLRVLMPVTGLTPSAYLQSAWGGGRGAGEQAGIAQVGWQMGGAAGVHVSRASREGRLRA